MGRPRNKQVGIRDLQEDPLANPLPIPVSQRWEGAPRAPGGKRLRWALRPSFPHPTRQTSQRGRGQPSTRSILTATRAGNPTPLPPKPLQVAGGRGWGRSRRSKCKGSRCWSLSFICGDGEREELEVGACLGTPRALCGVSWVRQETRRLGLGPKRGCWVALRDLGSKLGSPSTLGSLASNCKANLFGAGRGGGSPVGGEVTGIRCGRPRLLKPGNWPAPPPRHSQHPALEHGGARLHTRPDPPRAGDPAAQSRRRGANSTLARGGVGGGGRLGDENPGRILAAGSSAGAGSRG